MSGFSLVELQVAMYDRLSRDVVLSQTGARVFDYVPDGEAYPFVVLEDDEAQDNDSKPTDASDGQGLKVTSEVHAWSQYRGWDELKKMMSRIYGLLHDAVLEVPGQQVVVCRQTYSKLMRDPDGITRHGVQRFTIQTYSQG